MIDPATLEDMICGFEAVGLKGFAAKIKQALEEEPVENTEALAGALAGIGIGLLFGIGYSREQVNQTLAPLFDVLGDMQASDAVKAGDSN